jgi:hypothetical protein
MIWNVILTICVLLLAIDALKNRWHFSRLWKDTDSRLSEEAQERKTRVNLSKRVRRLEHNQRCCESRAKKVKMV